MKNWLHEPKQLKARKRTPYIIRAPSKGKERGRGRLQIHKLILELGKEGEEGISSHRKDHACRGAALDDAYEDEIEESLNSRDRGNSEVMREETVQEEAETARKPIMLENCMDPSMPNARERGLKVPKSQNGLLEKPIKIGLSPRNRIQIRNIQNELPFLDESPLDGAGVFRDNGGELSYISPNDYFVI